VTVARMTAGILAWPVIARSRQRDARGERGGDRVSVHEHWVLARGKRDARIRADGWRRPRVITLETALHEEES
jgi:hypothetical protein